MSDFDSLLDRLTMEANSTWKDATRHNDILFRIVQETMEGVNLAANFIDTESAIMEVSAKIEEIKKRGDDPSSFVKLRDVLSLLSNAIADRIAQSGNSDQPEN